jgi:hypothetical protein
MIDTAYSDYMNVAVYDKIAIAKKLEAFKAAIEKAEVLYLKYVIDHNEVCTVYKEYETSSKAPSNYLSKVWEYVEYLFYYDDVSGNLKTVSDYLTKALEDANDMKNAYNKALNNYK